MQFSSAQQAPAVVFKKPCEKHHPQNAGKHPFRTMRKRPKPEILPESTVFRDLAQFREASKGCFPAGRGVAKSKHSTLERRSGRSDQNSATKAVGKRAGQQKATPPWREHGRRENRNQEPGDTNRSNQIPPRQCEHNKPGKRRPRQGRRGPEKRKRYPRKRPYFLNFNLCPNATKAPRWRQVSTRAAGSDTAANRPQSAGGPTQTSIKDFRAISNTYQEIRPISNTYQEMIPISNTYQESRAHFKHLSRPQIERHTLT